ncbi:MAG: ABC transporter substrate-binding protein [Actinobacteria bacterium]|nr:MAG: ABC transporter substrate-binding protein [Actinomycetota bacterium]
MLACLVVAGGAAARTELGTSTKATKVTLQLKWVTQAQFAGYYAAKAKGYYSQAGLDVNLKVGGPTITPEQVVLGKQAEFGIDWVPSMLSFRDGGKKIMSIAQVFSKSGMTELTWKDSGITTIAKMRGKKVGVWCCGNENELYAALVKNGMDPKNKSDVTIVNQPFNMDLFLNHEVDAAAAMTYNELAQVLESKNSFKGWIYCRDHAGDCVKIVLKNGPALPGGHQKWQMNEINALIWPSKLGIGITSPTAFSRTAKIAQQFKVINNAPSGAYRVDLAKAAVAQLKAQGVDVYGKKWKKAKVKVTEGGK